MCRATLFALIGCSFALPTTGSAQDKEYPAVEFIRRIGGKEYREETFPSRPLVRVNLEGSRITDDGIKELHPLKDLAHLNLSKTKITDEGLKDLPAIKTLLELDLSQTEITDNGIDELAKIEKLHTLNLSGTKITGEGVKKLAGFKRLETLTIVEIQIPTDALKSVMNNPKLVYLAFDRELITDEVFRMFFEAKRLHVLHQAEGTHKQRATHDNDIRFFDLYKTNISKKEALKLWELSNYLTDTTIRRANINDERFELILKHNKTAKIELDSSNSTLLFTLSRGELSVNCLDLIETEITEASFSQFHKIPKLTGVQLPKIQPTEKGWKEIGSLNELTFLHLRETELDATALREIGKLKKLKHLEVSVSNNNVKLLTQLKKALPDCWMTLVRSYNGEAAHLPREILEELNNLIPEVPPVPPVEPKKKLPSIELPPIPIPPTRP